MRTPDAAVRISQLAAVLGTDLFKKVLAHLTVRELVRVNRALARCPHPSRHGLGALLGGVHDCLAARRRERRAVAGLVHLDLFIVWFGLLAGVFLLFLAAGSGALERLRLTAAVQGFAQVGGAEFFLLALFSVVLRRERALRLRSLLVPLERRAAHPANRRRELAVDAGCGIVVGLFLAITLSVLNAATGETAPVPTGWLFPVHLAAGLFAAPLFEEGFFRYWLGGTILAEAGPGPAVLIPALAFALAHAPGDLAEACGYLVCGAALGLLWWKRRGALLAPALAHAVANLVTILGGR